MNEERFSVDDLESGKGSVEVLEELNDGEGKETKEGEGKESGEGSVEILANDLTKSNDALRALVICTPESSQEQLPVPLDMHPLVGNTDAPLNVIKPSMNQYQRRPQTTLKIKIRPTARVSDSVAEGETKVDGEEPEVVELLEEKAIAHSYEQMKSTLVDFTSQTFLNKVKCVESYIEQEYGQEVVAKCSKSGRLRSHKKEAFIKIAAFADLQRSPSLVLSSEMMKKMVVSKEKKLKFDEYVKKFMESSKFVVSDNLCRDIEKLEKATEQLEDLINRDLRLADYLHTDVVERLVQILENIDYRVTQGQAVHILSTVSYDKCREVINKQAVPALVGLMTDSFYPLANKAVITLTRLACASSTCVKVILDNFALETAWEVVKKFPERYANDVIENISLLLAAVCRANNLSADQEKVALIILQNLLEKDLYPSTHIQRACYALSYLSYERHVEVTKEVCKSLVELLSHDEIAVVGSALGVVGNICRWGSLIQIQHMTKDWQLLKCLGKSVLCSEIKKFRQEACQIISNVAVRSEIQIKDEAGLIERLLKLFEEDEDDVKMEAAWAIYNSISASEI